jgi:hypothetical protein
VALFDIVEHMHGLGEFDDERKHTIKVPLGRFKIPVLKLERVLASKRATGRPKDKLVLSVLADSLAATRARSRRARQAVHRPPRRHHGPRRRRGHRHR